MLTDLTDADKTRFTDALHECVEIARTYRHTIGDEDSIVLIRDLNEMSSILKIDLPDEAR